jgi:hypothetical protein
MVKPILATLVASSSLMSAALSIHDVVTGGRAGG